MKSDVLLIFCCGNNRNIFKSNLRQNRRCVGPGESIYFGIQGVLVLQSMVKFVERRSINEKKREKREQERRENKRQRENK